MKKAGAKAKAMARSMKSGVMKAMAKAADVVGHHRLGKELVQARAQCHRAAAGSERRRDHHLQAGASDRHTGAISQ